MTEENGAQVRKKKNWRGGKVKRHFLNLKKLLLCRKVANFESP